MHPTKCLQEAEVSITSFSIPFWTSPGLVCPIIGQSNGVCISYILVIFLPTSSTFARKGQGTHIAESVVRAKVALFLRYYIIQVDCALELEVHSQKRSKVVENADEPKWHLYHLKLHYTGGLCSQTKCFCKKRSKDKTRGECRRGWVRI